MTRQISTRIMLVSCLLCLTGGARAERWYTYEDCRLIPNASNDGDSFHVKTKSNHFIFRLYFVDCAETSRQVPARVVEQAEYWGIKPDAALSLGKDAAAFTTKFLKDRFTVYSKREDARGASKMPRFFAMVKVGDEYLSEALVRAGLARVYGSPTELPNGSSSSKYWGRLRAAERAAKRRKAGGWAPPDASVESAGPEPVTGRDVRTRHRTAVYSLPPQSRFIGFLPADFVVHVVEAAPDGRVVVRFRHKNRDVEGLCRRRELGL